MIWRGEELLYRDNCRYGPERMTMEGLGMYEGFSHMANIFLTVPDSAGGREMLDEIRALQEETADCEGGVSLLASGDLAVRILGNRAQTLQNLAEEIKKKWEVFL
jgi:urease accessory protein